jgi:hypothetical protein
MLLEPPLAPPGNGGKKPSAQPSDIPRQPAPLRPSPGGSDLLPETPSPFEPEDLPSRGTDGCDRIYNGRNCCDEDRKCDAVRRRFRENPISKISLDITPSFRPDALDRADLEQKRDAQLNRAGEHTWKNRAGQVLAEGRLTDYTNGRVVIATSDGGTERIPTWQLSDDDLCFLAGWWGLPSECSLGDEQFAGRDWIPATFTWKASALCHKPLYFEEEQLERYGHTTGPFTEPFVAGAHFFLNIAALPYNMTLNPPQECKYALGYYRPGSCAPWLIHPVPLNLRAALVQAGVITGGVFLLP